MSEIRGASTQTVATKGRQVFVNQGENSEKGEKFALEAKIQMFENSSDPSLR